ncbi:hypothetical protein DV735_g1161, partial [Chaetothyriales sp. CBS 134920]
MPKAMGLSALDLSATSTEIDGRAPRSPFADAGPSLLSPRSAPASPAIDRSVNPAMQLTGSMGPLDIRRGSSSHTTSPLASTMPEFGPPSSGRLSPRQHTREASKSFFSNLRASRSTQKLNSSDTTGELMTEKQGARNGHGLYKSVYAIRRQGSSPELPRYTMGDSSWGSGPKAQAQAQAPTELPAETVTAVQALPVVPPPPPPATKAKSKSRFGLGIARAKTVKPEDAGKAPPHSAQLKVDMHGANDHEDPGPKTAPLKSDYRSRALGADGTSASRGAEGQGSDDMAVQRKAAVPTPSGSIPASHSMHLLSNISHTGKGVGDRIGKAGKGLFGKITRSGSNNEREPGVGPVAMEEAYTLRTINLPLVQQTRKTRIARRLESSRDKTEFWMPALPWRCIDYLNMNGCEEEGLYRIPGSGKEVKHWQRRFDTEYDINLFEEPDLHDINTIGSMFKAWLRDLPDEILPKSVQNKVAQECAGATRTPQLFKDELSKLPPFNYYLLFAITCHLSLLTSFSDKNRMDYRNLCICFQPCLKMDAFCFQFLVMDWKNCWQGCWTEKEYLEEEYRYEREGSPGESDEVVTEEMIGVSSSGGGRSTSSNSQTSPRRDHGVLSHVSHGRNTEEDGVTRQLPKTADGTSRKSTLRPVKARSRSASEMRQSTMSSGHQAASSVPLVPRVVTTPEPPETRSHIPPPEKLPELGSLSPIRM